MPMRSRASLRALDAVAVARFQAEWRPVGRPESAPDLELRAHSDAKPVSTLAACALARFQAEWRPVGRPESAPDLELGAHSDAKPVSTFAACALAVCAILLVAAGSLPAPAQGLPKGSPEEAGFSPERLQRLTRTFQAHVDNGDLAGAVVLIARDGKLAYLEPFGFQNREDRIPMRTDAIFRIASMTKPFTSVAVMMLAEEARIDIADPAWRYLPELKDPKVGVETVDPDSGKPSLSLAPARRQVTVQDLLRHTSGFTYQFIGKQTLVKQAYANAKVLDPGQTLAEMVTKLAGLPLSFQPGTTFDYGMSTDVLGRMVETVSGMELDRFIGERITAPLGLASTGFSVRESDVGRIAEPQADPATGRRPPSIAAAATLARKPRWLSGGGGMVSTAEDYARFCQMLLNGGELDGVRLLSPSTVALMTADHLPPGVGYDQELMLQFKDTAPTPEMGQGFGLGFAVRKDAGRNPLPGAPGSYYWQGAWGTAFWVDPRNRLIAVLMIQVPPGQIDRYRQELRYLVYQAMTGPVGGPASK